MTLIEQLQEAADNDDCSVSDFAEFILPEPCCDRGGVDGEHSRKCDDDWRGEIEHDRRRDDRGE